MQFAKADIQNLEGIRSIWEEQFTTDCTYLDIMFRKIMPQCTSYVCKEGARIISTLSLMPMYFIDDITGIKLSGWYMFGVATLKEFWGKRLAAQTIEFSSLCIEKDGYSFIFERPANQTLNGYYSKLGFTKPLNYISHHFKTPQSYGSTGNITAETNTKIVAEKILKEIRQNHPKRFEWKNLTILQSLIQIGELEFNNTNYCKTPPENVFISIKTINKTPEEIFNNTFFCFPME